MSFGSKANGKIFYSPLNLGLVCIQILKEYMYGEHLLEQEEIHSYERSTIMVWAEISFDGRALSTFFWIFLLAESYVRTFYCSIHSWYPPKFHLNVFQSHWACLGYVGPYSFSKSRWVVSRFPVVLDGNSPMKVCTT